MYAVEVVVLELLVVADIVENNNWHEHHDEVVDEVFVVVVEEAISDADAVMDDDADKLVVVEWDMDEVDDEHELQVKVYQIPLQNLFDEFE